MVIVNRVPLLHKPDRYRAFKQRVIAGAVQEAVDNLCSYLGIRPPEVDMSFLDSEELTLTCHRWITGDPMPEFGAKE